MQSLGRPALLALCVPLLSLSSVASAADKSPTSATPPPPATAPAGDPDAGIHDQLEAARDLLDAGKWKDARDAFRRASLKSPRSVMALHGEGLAGLQMNDDGFAAGVFDKAIAAAPAPTRALAYNTAVARIRTNQPIAAAQVLRTYLTLPSAGNDEPLLDALQLSLRHADDAAEDPNHPEARTTSIMDELKSVHESADAYREKLEKTRPGLKRWGNTWLSAADADQKRNRLAHAQAEIEGATRAVSEQEGIVQQREASLEHTKESGHLVGAVGRHRDELNHATKELDQRMNKLQRMRTDIQALLPPEPASLAPIAIDDDTPPPVSGTVSSGGGGDDGAGGGGAGHHKKKGKH